MKKFLPFLALFVFWLSQTFYNIPSAQRFMSTRPEGTQFQVTQYGNMITVYYTVVY